MKTLLLILLLVPMMSFGQDVIIKKNGDEIKSKIIEITLNNIRYKAFDFQTGPIRNILVSDVFMVKYENGTKEMFDSKENEPIVDEPIIVKSELTDKDTTEYSLYNILNPSPLKKRDMIVFQIGNMFYKGTVIMKSGNGAINVSANKISQKRNNQWVESPPKETYTVDKKQILYIKRTL